MTNWMVILKYPWAALIIGLVWLGGAVLVLHDPSLPVVKMVGMNMVASLVMGYVGFRTKSR